MTHEDAGHYAGKHPSGTELNPAIADAVRKASSDGKVTCAAAFRIVREMALSPRDVGVAIDLLETRIAKCQLGLYGYEPQSRILKPADHVSDELKHAIEDALVDGRITCVGCWDIAKRLSCAKMHVAEACEAMHVKISQCQLGSFK